MGETLSLAWAENQSQRLALPKQPQEVIERIQKRRNRIEHHRYDHKEEDESIISESLAFILFFAEGVLKAKLENDLSPETLREIQSLVYDRQDRYWIAMHRLEQWMHETWPDWDYEASDTPDEFGGTLDCPICRQSYLIIGYHDKPFCFHCNTSVDAVECDDCGRTYLASEGCCP